ncbi:MAG: branched-chain amino acid transport system II carrier protein [Balneolaceae bacterium]|nr:MAG: branched-chain amino acid transport system II carrier protein [Balneolaceae bacterium]
MRQTNKDMLVVGVALFAMFFGAGNLIFPPYMGLLAGTDWRWALLGFLITGIGMPLLGIIAAARAGGTVEDMGRRVGPWFGRLLGIVIILAIGPLLAIPRTGATAFELGIRPSLPGFSTVLFSVIFFAVTLWFALNRSAVVDKIGKYLTPFLVVTLAWIIIRGIFMPLGSIAETELQGAAGRGFREGYQTMDALASLVFAQIVIGTLVLKGYDNVKDQVKMASVAGGIAALGLGLVYGGLMYLGASASSMYPPSVERTDLLIAIASGLMGDNGKIVLGLAVSLACLTTAIGLTATVADYFSGMSGGRIGYKLIAVVTVVFSGIFATVGVTTIVNVAFPLLITVYPVAIALILLTLIGGVVAHRAVYIGAVAGGLLTSIPEALTEAGLPVVFLNTVVGKIPFAGAGFAWILPVIAGALIGLFVVRFRRKQGNVQEASISG